MNTYRIYTEDLNRERILEATTHHFPDGYTYWITTGMWKGVREDSIIIEIVDDSPDNTRVRTLAQYIKHTNKQQAVMITTTPCNMVMI